jgi:uracil-DNA glycosylase
MTMRESTRARALREFGITTRWSLRVPFQTLQLAAPPEPVATDQAAAPPAPEIAKLGWSDLATTVAACELCQLCKTRTQTVFGVGPQRAPWMVIGEAPGQEEDREGFPFVGQAGRLLDQMLLSIGLDRTNHVYIANVLKCRPPRNRDPLPAEIASCQPYLFRQIELIGPRLIVVVGRFAAQTLLGTDAAISSLRGRVHLLKRDNLAVPVVVTYHPAYLLRSPAEKAKAWADLCLARETFAAIQAEASV